MSDGMDTLVGPVAPPEASRDISPIIALETPEPPEPPESPESPETPEVSSDVSPSSHALAERAVPLSREQILDATDQCLAGHGYDGTTIRRIAAAMQCAVGSIYRYFEDKRQLLEAVTQRRFEEVTARAEGGAPIEATTLAYAQQATEDPQAYRLMFWLGSMRRDVTTPAEATPAVVRRLIAAWARQLGDEDRAQRLWSFVHGAIMLGRDPHRAMRDAQTLMVRKAMPTSGATPGVVSGGTSAVTSAVTSGVTSGGTSGGVHIVVKQPLATAS